MRIYHLDIFLTEIFASHIHVNLGQPLCFACIPVSVGALPGPIHSKRAFLLGLIRSLGISYLECRGGHFTNCTWIETAFQFPPV